MRFFLVTLMRAGFFFICNSITVANVARLGISVHCYLVRLLSLCWITGRHTIHPPIERLLPSTSTEPTPFQNLAFKVAGLQLHATTPS